MAASYPMMPPLDPMTSPIKVIWPDGHTCIIGPCSNTHVPCPQVSTAVTSAVAATLAESLWTTTRRSTPGSQPARSVGAFWARLPTCAPTCSSYTDFLRMRRAFWCRRGRESSGVFQMKMARSSGDGWRRWCVDSVWAYRVGQGMELLNPLKR